MKQALIVSPYFPPSAQACVHRARHMANHLEQFGWHPRILRVAPEYYEEALDHDLLTLVSDSLDMVTTNALPASLTRKFGIGDLGLRSFFALRAALIEQVQSHKPDIVFLSGSPFYPLLLARTARALGFKVVMDFQDPWASDYGAGQPFWSKRGLTYRLARLLEPRALACADAVTSVSPTQNEALQQRYPRLQSLPMAAIPIGGDPADFERLRTRPPATLLAEPPASGVCLNYVGTYLPRSEPLMTVLFKAVGRLLSEQPDLREQLRLNFVGTSNQLKEIAVSPVRQLADQLGVGDVVYEYPRRVPFLEALYWLDQADGVLMIGSDERHYTASKIYPGLMSGKPFLALFHRDSSSFDLLGKALHGMTFGFSDAAELIALELALAEGLLALIQRQAQLAAPDPAVYREVTAAAVTGQYAALFDELVP